MKTIKIASTGSQYHRVNGVTFRIADHLQPSHYQSKEYYNINTVGDIDIIINNPLFNFYANPIEKDGKHYNAIYDEKRDGFDMNEITYSEYLELINKMAEKKQFMIDNGWMGNINF